MRITWFMLGLIVLAAPRVGAQVEPQKKDGAKKPQTVWEYLAGKYDANGDGAVAADEYDRGAATFKRLDRDGDGRLTAADFPEGGSRRRGPRPDAGDRRKRMLGRLFSTSVDADADGSVAPEEWQAFLTRADADADGIADAAVIAGDGPARRRQQLERALDLNGDGVLRIAELKQAFSDLDGNRNGVLEWAELSFERGRRGGQRANRGRPEELPKPGDVAPDFELPRLGGEETVKLSSFAGKRPVALIFGSYT